MGVKANLDRDTIVSAGAAVADARRQAAVGQHRVAVACLEYADLRRELDRSDDPAGRRRSSRAQRGEFVADELAIMLRQQPWSVRCLVARSRRVRGELPTVWEAFGRGEVDVEQVLMIDRIARRATRVDTRIAIDDQAVAAAQTRSPKQLGAFCSGS